MTCGFAALGGGWQTVLTITDRAIRSTLTLHASERAGDGGWQVSWLAGRVLSAGQAEAAMLIAEAACDLDADCDPELYDPGSSTSANTNWP